MTDANLVLGRFVGAGLLGGEMKLDEARAAKVLDELADEMTRASSRTVTREEAALGVIRVANANMEQALRLVSVERGHDPDDLRWSVSAAQAGCTRRRWPVL